MASLKKFNGTTWDIAKVRKLTTATDTITTLPADVYADGTNATVGLVGNMSQSGTPTSSNPVDVNGVGVRTENFAYDILVQDLQPLYSIVLLFSADLEPDTTYTLSFDSISGFYFYINEQVFNVKYINTVTGRNQVICTTKSTLDKSDNRQYLNGRWVILKNAMNQLTNIDITNVMLNSGSTAKPYEPYGYKIPISSANTTTPVYLGEVESTRKIKKLVFDGTENVSYNARNDTLGRWVVTIPTANGTATPENVICTHFKTVNNTTKPLSEGGICMRSTGVDVVVGGVYTDIGITAPSDSTTIVNAVKAWLAQQYAAGTPVTVWYVLATLETAVVNEPLRKIGEYADTVSGISIPTIAGKDIFDVLTSLKPSEVSLTYTGWHDATVKEWDGSEWQ